jgi:four helix bundle protein
MYKITASFPALENYGLTSQIRRAASSINANLMEGSARQTNKEFKQFIYVSRGSANELIYHIMLARDLGYIKPETANKCIEELHGISKMLNGLLKTLN